MEMSKFDLESVYDNEISPLVAEIIRICKRAGMPMLTSFCYAAGRNEDDPGSVNFCTTYLDNGSGYQPDELKEAVRIIRNGASTRPKLMAFTITNEITHEN